VSADGHAVRVLQGDSFSFAIERTVGVVDQRQDLFIGQTELAADRSVDVLSELATVESGYPAVEKSLQSAVDQP
jgi:hypothetical protein